MSKKRFYFRLIAKLVIIGIVVAIDLLTKFYFETYYKLGGEDYSLINGVLGITNVKNTGGAFGMLSSNTTTLIIFTVLFLCLEAETYHIKPTSQVQKGADGTLFRTYKMLRGSSTYDTKEMSYLIDGLVGECRELGIETLPPRELERMMAVYEQNHNKSMRRTD